MSKIEEKELRAPDAFIRLGAKVTEVAMAYSQLLVGVGGILLVVSLVWAGYHWWSTHQEEGAQAALYTVEKDFLKKKEDFSRAEMMKKMADLDEKNKKGEKAKATPAVATGDLEKDYGSEVKSLEGVATQFSGSRAAVVASVDLADLYGQYHQVDKAIETLQRAEKSLSSRELLYGVVLMKRAALESEKGDCATAVGTFEKILKSQRHSFFHAEATLRSGVCLEVMKDLAGAKQMYQDAAEKFPESTAAQSAQKYLQLLEMQQQEKAEPGQS